MNTKLSHTIQNTTLDISYPSKQSYSKNLPRIDKSFQKMLHSVIETAFNEFGKEGTYLALEKIEIDLGDFRPADIETVLPQRVFTQIRNVLKSSFPSSTVAGTGAVQKQAESLIYYFERGYLPWWLTVEKAPTIDNWLAGALESDTGIVALFRSLPRNTAFVNRILSGILEPTLQGFIKTLEPGNYNLILEYRKNTERAIRNEKKGKLEANGKYSKVVTIILHYLLNDRGTFFNSTQFLTNTLHKISAHYNIEYATLLQLLQKSLALTHSPGSYNSVLNAIKQVTDAELPDKTPVTSEETPLIPNTFLKHFTKQTFTKNSTSRPGAEVTFRLFIYNIINKGTGPFGSSISTAEIDMVFGFMFRNYSADLKTMLYQPQNRVRKAFFISRLCSDKVIEGIIRLMEPAQAGSIITYRNKINKLPAENVGIKDSSKNYKQVVNEVIIAYLMLKKQSLFNTRQFIITTITNLAARYNIKVNHLLLSLAHSLKSDNSQINYQAELFEIIKSITTPNGSPVFAGVTTDKPKPLNPRELLAYYLRNGHLPAWVMNHAKNEKGETDVAGYLKKMLAEESEKSLTFIVSLVREFYGDMQSSQRFLKLISSAGLYEKLFKLFKADLNGARHTLQYFNHWFYNGIPAEQVKGKLIDGICRYIAYTSNYSYAGLIKWLVSSHIKTYKHSTNLDLVHQLFFKLDTGNNVKSLLFNNTLRVPNWQGKYFKGWRTFSSYYQFNKQIQPIIKEELDKQFRKTSDSTFLKIAQLFTLLKDNTLLPGELSFISHLPLADLRKIWAGQKQLSATFTNPANLTGRQLIIYNIVKLLSTGKLSTAASQKLRYILAHSNDAPLILSFLKAEEIENYIKLISKNKIPPQHTATLSLFAQVLSNEENGVKIKPVVFWSVAVKRVQQISAFNIKNTLAKILTDISVLLGKNIKPLLQNLIHNLIAFDRPEYRGILNLLISISGDKALLQPGIATKNKANLKDKLKLAEALKEKQKPQQREPEEDIYVSNAGLCLLQGYVPRLFSMLKYTEDGTFVSDDARAKAIRMQQFLVTGFDNDDDFHLVLNKILCGVGLDFVVDTNVNLSDEERQTGINMLKGVIQNWPEIKNSSVEGFRGNFLIRNGKIVNKDGTRRLSVEKKPYDLLLKTLPWGFTLIKHKWMDKPLTVEWI